jgi:hypothetical protein
MPTPVLKEKSYATAVAKAERAALGLNKKRFKIFLTDPRGSSITTDSDDGRVYLPIDVDMDGYELTTYILMVSGRSSSGGVTVMARRDRAGTVVDMATTGATIDASEDASSTGTAPTMHSTNKLVASADRVWFKVTAGGTSAEGLTLTAVFTEV